MFGAASGIAPETEKLADRGYYQGAMNTAEDARRAQQQQQQIADKSAYAQGQNAAQARDSQASALSLQQQAAMGNAPSRAELLSRHQMDQAASAQQSLAAGARGPAALAMAQQQAAGNTARSMSDISANTSAMRADEMAQARNAYIQGATGMRGQDLGAQQMEYNRQAQTDASQRAWAGQGLGIEQQQIGKDQADRNDYWNFYNAASGQAAKTADSNSSVMQGVGSAALGAAMFLSDVRTKENVRGIAPSEMDQYLSAMQPASYNYVAGVGPGGTQVGPASAQALASTQLGKSVVEQRPDGLLAINGPAALKAGMAADSHINDKASRAEAKANAALAALGTVTDGDRKAAITMQAPQYADSTTASLMSLRQQDPATTGIGAITDADRKTASALLSRTAAPMVISAKPAKDDWLAQQLAAINATNNVKGPR